MTTTPSGFDDTAGTEPVLDPGLQAWLDRVNHAQQEGRKRGVPDTPESARLGLATLTRTQGGLGPALADIKDIRVGLAGVPVRLYDPLPGETKAVCVFLHGGGHMAGSVDVYDPICRRLAAATGRLIASVDYRLSPEHPYPAGLADALTVLNHLPATLADEGYTCTGQVALAGDSGGGALAATLASITRRHHHIALDRLVLIYPSLDYTLTHPSLEENGIGYLLETEKIRWYFDHYFQHEEDRQQASPLYLPVQDLPPTFVITAGLCPLRDEGFAYLARLGETRVPHEHLHMPGLIHAYLNLHELVPEACTRTYAAIGGFLRRRVMR